MPPISVNTPQVQQHSQAASNVGMFASFKIKVANFLGLGSALQGTGPSASPTPPKTAREIERRDVSAPSTTGANIDLVKPQMSLKEAIAKSLPDKSEIGTYLRSEDVVKRNQLAKDATAQKALSNDPLYCTAHHVANAPGKKEFLEQFSTVKTTDELIKVLTNPSVPKELKTFIDESLRTIRTAGLKNNFTSEQITKLQKTFVNNALLLRGAVPQLMEQAPKKADGSIQISDLVKNFQKAANGVLKTADGAALNKACQSFTDRLIPDPLNDLGLIGDDLDSDPLFGANAAGASPKDDGIDFRRKANPENFGDPFIETRPQAVAKRTEQPSRSNATILGKAESDPLTGPLHKAAKAKEIISQYQGLIKSFLNTDSASGETRLNESEKIALAAAHQESTSQSLDPAEAFKSIFAKALGQSLTDDLGYDKSTSLHTNEEMGQLLDQAFTEVYNGNKGAVTKAMSDAVVDGYNLTEAQQKRADADVDTVPLKDFLGTDADGNLLKPLPPATSRPAPEAPTAPVTPSIQQSDKTPPSSEIAQPSTSAVGSTEPPKTVKQAEVDLSKTFSGNLDEFLSKSMTSVSVLAGDQQNLADLISTLPTNLPERRTLTEMMNAVEAMKNATLDYHQQCAKISAENPDTARRVVAFAAAFAGGKSGQANGSNFDSIEKLIACTKRIAALAPAVQKFLIEKEDLVAAAGTKLGRSTFQMDLQTVPNIVSQVCTRLSMPINKDNGTKELNSFIKKATAAVQEGKKLSPSDQALYDARESVLANLAQVLDSFTFINEVPQQLIKGMEGLTQARDLSQRLLKASTIQISEARPEISAARPENLSVNALGNALLSKFKELTDVADLGGATLAILKDPSLHEAPEVRTGLSRLPGSMFSSLPDKIAAFSSTIENNRSSINQLRAPQIQKVHAYMTEAHDELKSALASKDIKAIGLARTKADEAMKSLSGGTAAILRASGNEVENQIGNLYLSLDVLLR